MTCVAVRSYGALMRCLKGSHCSSDTVLTIWGLLQACSFVIDGVCGPYLAKCIRNLW